MKLVDFALTYAQKGWRVIPVNSISDGHCSCGQTTCDSPGKHPLISNWTQDASADPAVLRRWFDQYPAANIAILTGEGSGVFVLDVDGSTGEMSLEDLEEGHGSLAETLTCMTGRGRHLYFRYPGRHVKISASVLGEGLDVRGDGGSAILPPSRHVNGAVYHWQDEDRPVAEAPPWLIDLVCRTSAVAVGSIAGEPGEPIPEGKRHRTLIEIGSSLRGRGCDVEEIEESLMRINDEQCDPPLERAEVKTIVNSVGKFPEGERKVLRRNDNPFWWFRFDAKEYLSDTRITLLTDYQRGWWTSLRAAAWQNEGYLPNDPAQLAKLAQADSPRKFKREIDTIFQFFDVTEDGDQIFDPGLVALWNEKKELSDKNSKSGAKGAQNKYRPSNPGVGA